MSSSQTSDPVLYTRSGMVGEAAGSTAPSSSPGNREVASSSAASSPEPTSRRSAREALPLPPDPYPGLRPFTHNESRLFCGRVMERLRLLNLLAESDFVAVLGSSGSGKSSLVLSGLIPDIRSGKLPGAPAAGMEFATFRPGRNPYANLAAALYKTWLGEGLPDPFFIEENLRRSPLTLAQMCVFKEKAEEKVSANHRRITEANIKREEMREALRQAAIKHATALREVTACNEAAVEFPCSTSEQRLSDAYKILRELSAVLQKRIQEASRLEGAAPLSILEIHTIVMAATPLPADDAHRLSHEPPAPILAPAPAPPRSLIIVVDQFEEIFRFASLVAKEQDEESATRRDFRPVAGELDEAQAFISLLLSAARDSAGRVRVVITMRSDFFKHCEVFEGLPEAIAAHQFITPRMCREQMEDAIQMPLDHFGSTISEELVNEMLNDVHGEFDQLPVLQHALARMWHQAKALRPPQPAELTAEDYRRAGRLSGAMNAHGDELITNNQLIPAQVASFFRCLGDFDPTSGQAIRRPRTVAQISAESALSIAEICRIATVFAHPEASFITATPALPEPGALPEGDIIIDLTHECLLRKWQACTEWMRQEKREGDALKSLSQRMDDHLTPGQYQRFSEQLKDTTTRPQAWAARYACDLAKTRAFLATEKRHAFRQRWRWPIVGALLLVIVADALVSFSIYKARAHEVLAAEQKKRADAETLAAAEQKKRADAEAKRADAEAKFAAVQEQVKKLAEGQSTAQSGSISTVGELKSRLNEVEAGKAELGGVITTLLKDTAADRARLPEETLKKLKELGYSMGEDPPRADTRPAYTSISSSRKIEVFGTTTKSSRPRIASLLRVALLPDPGKQDPYQYQILAGGAGGLWRQVLSERAYVPPEAVTAATDQKPPAPAQVWEQDAATLSISTQPDSTGWILATNGGPDIGLSKDGGSSKFLTLTTHSPGVSCARMLSGRRLVYGTTNGKIGLIDLGQDEVKDGVIFDSEHKRTLTDLVASPDGTLLVASGDDSFATLWRIQDGLTLTPLDLGKYGKTGAPIHGASFSPDSRWLLIPAGDKSIRLCLLHTQGTTIQVVKALNLPHDNFVNFGSFSPDGRWIATTDISGKVYIWRSIPVPLNDAAPQPVGLFTGHTTAISALAWSPNSAGLATTDQTGAVIVWRLQIGDTVSGVPLIMPTAAREVEALAWSPDSSLLATADAGGTAQVHPLAFHARVSQEPVADSDLLPDGLYIPSKNWPPDFADAAFLGPNQLEPGAATTPQVSVSNPANGMKELIWLLVDNAQVGPAAGLSQSVTERLKLAAGAEIEISVSKLVNQRPPANEQTVRMKAARFVFEDEVSRDPSGRVQIVRTEKGVLADLAGLSNASLPALFDWFEIFIAEGMYKEVENAAIDCIASKSDVINRWVDAPTGNPDDPATTATYNALQAYLRCLYYSFGAPSLQGCIQRALGDPVDVNLISPATKSKLTHEAYTNIFALFDKIDQSLMQIDKSPQQAAIVAKVLAKARTFAKSFLGPTTTSAADQRLIDRARSAIGKATQYQLGEGGMDPTAPHPASGGKCDNSGFIAWVLGQSRLTKDPLYTTASNDGGWMDVTSMQKDITTAGGMLSQVTEPYPGCIAAYGSGPDTPRNAALITAVIVRDGRTIPSKLINCTKENWTQKKEAIQEIPADGFLANPTTIYGHLDPPKP